MIIFVTILLFLWSVAVPSLLVSSKKDTSSSIDFNVKNDTHSQFMNSSILSNLISYEIYFRNSKKNKCFANEINNKSYSLFINSVDRSPNDYYMPRHLSTSQISWRVTPIKNITDNAVNTSENDNNNSTDLVNNINGISNINNSTGNKDISNINTNTTEEDNRKEILHKYLAFAILLPQHPFSMDLLESLIPVGQMFPSVAFVTGNGYEFRALCSQYAVRSFPHLLFFEDGLLKHRYQGIHSIPEVASKLGEWTQSLPKSHLSLISSNTTFIHDRNKKSKREYYYFWAPMSFFTVNVFGYNVKAQVPYSTEPIMGTFNSLVPYDSLIFLLAGCFVLLRFTYFFCTGQLIKYKV